MTAARDAPASAVQIAAMGYLAKPFDLAELFACVARYRPSHEWADRSAPACPRFCVEPMARPSYGFLTIENGLVHGEIAYI